MLLCFPPEGTDNPSCIFQERPLLSLWDAGVSFSLFLFLSLFFSFFLSSVFFIPSPIPIQVWKDSLF
ncbi:MAG TPA: hypothetical protein DCG32_01905 [Sphaerochaeta sp.]|nr:hypothetical protein [Sphaerochaeta sp.]